MNFTRRDLALVALQVATAAAQTSPEAPENLPQTAREEIGKNSEALAKVKVPMGTEPAFHFKA